MGCSAHRVPSLSNVATRFGRGTKFGPPSFATPATKARTARFAGPSFQDGSGSPAFGWAAAGAVKTPARAIAKSARRVMSDLRGPRAAAGPPAARRERRPVLAQPPLHLLD